jgi:hypothetical protein
MVKHTTMRTVSENARSAAAKKREASKKAGMGQVAAGRPPAGPTPLAQEIASDDRDIRIKELEGALRYESYQRQRLSDEVEAVARHLSRCGPGEGVIASMLFGIVRWHGTMPLGDGRIPTQEPARASTKE